MSTALSRSLPLAIALSDVRSARDVSSAEMDGSPLESNPSSSRSSLPRSGSGSSLESSSTSSSPTTSELRKHLSTVKPVKSCLSARDKNGRRKNVTFSFDDALSSSEDLSSTSLQDTLVLDSDNMVEMLTEENELAQRSRSLDPRDREHKHMEAKALLQYHANMGVAELNGSDGASNSPIHAERTSTPPPPHYSSTSSQNHSQILHQQDNIVLCGNNRGSENESSRSEAQKSQPFASPLSSLRSIGSELDRSNSVLQSFMQRAAIPEHDTNATTGQNGWILSAGFLVTAPVVFSLVMDTILG